MVYSLMSFWLEGIESVEESRILKSVVSSSLLKQGEKEMPNWQKEWILCYVYVSKKSFETWTGLIQHCSYCGQFEQLFMHIHSYIYQKSTGKGNFFLCKRTNVMLFHGIKSFLSINSFNLELSVELIKLVVIEYVHY